MGVTSGQDSTDRVRAVRRSGPEAAGRGKTRDLHLPGLYPLLWATPQERNLHRMADYMRKSEWLRNSKPSRLSFNAGCMIAWPMSVLGSGKLCWVITNTTLFPETRLSCASSNFACAGYGRVFWSAVVNAQRCVGNVLPPS